MLIETFRTARVEGLGGSAWVSRDYLLCFIVEPFWLSVSDN